MAAPSSTDICNFALTHIGRSSKPLTTLTENSIEARLCTIWYDQCRREALEIMDWSFARRRLTLALHADAPPDEWVYRYQVPSDMLSFLLIWNPFIGVNVPNANFPLGFWNSLMGDVTNAVPFSLELSLDGTQLTLLTNQQSAIGLYTADIEDTALFSSQFINTLAHLIGSKIGYSLTGKMSVKQDQEKAFVAALAAAAADNANQQVSRPPRDGYTVRARA